MLGKGSTSEVFGVCTDTVKKTVELMSTDASLAEISILNMLDHPHVVRMRHWHFAETANLFIERGDCNLQTYILSNPKPKNSWCEMLAGAIAYIHSRGIIHGDLKLDNIIVFGDIVKICDFGLATILTEKKTPYLIQSPMHRAPESWLKAVSLETYCDAKYSYNVDSWSFGIILILLDKWQVRVTQRRIIKHCNFSILDYTYADGELCENDAKPLLASEINSKYAVEIAACLVKNRHLRASMREIAAMFGVQSDGEMPARKYAEITAFYDNWQCRDVIKQLVIDGIVNINDTAIPTDIMNYLRDWRPFNDAAND